MKAQLTPLLVLFSESWRTIVRSAQQYKKFAIQSLKGLTFNSTSDV